MLQKHFHTQEAAMDEWPFWMLEENIKIVNEIVEEEDNQRKKDEGDQQKGMPDTGSMMKNASNMSNISMPNF
jgi:hypothetical protein